jgi:uncharacterized Zn finger protein (UPF0148 family)
MNIPALAEKVVETVKNVPMKTKSYMCHGDYHSYEVMDKEACELAVQELLDRELNTGMISNELRPLDEIPEHLKFAGSDQFDGPCESCGTEIEETKNFDGVVLCPVCKAGVGMKKVMEERERDKEQKPCTQQTVDQSCNDCSLNDMCSDETIANNGKS